MESHVSLKKKKSEDHKEWCETHNIQIQWDPIWNGKHMKAPFKALEKCKMTHEFGCSMCNGRFTRNGWRDIKMSYIHMRLEWSNTNWFCSYECFMEKNNRILTYFENKPSISDIIISGSVSNALTIGQWYYCHNILCQSEQHNITRHQHNITRHQIGQALKHDEDLLYSKIKHNYKHIYTYLPKELTLLIITYTF